MNLVCLKKLKKKQVEISIKCPKSFNEILIGICDKLKNLKPKMSIKYLSKVD